MLRVLVGADLRRVGVVGSGKRGADAGAGDHVDGCHCRCWLVVRELNRALRVGRLDEVSNLERGADAAMTQLELIIVGPKLSHSLFLQAGEQTASRLAARSGRALEKIHRLVDSAVAEVVADLRFEVVVVEADLEERLFLLGQKSGIGLGAGGQDRGGHCRRCFVGFTSVKSPRASVVIS